MPTDQGADVWLAGIVTVSAPRSAGSAKSPDCETAIDTARSAVGAGKAFTVKVAAAPSVTAPPAEIEISGCDTGPSLSLTVTSALPFAEDTV